MNRHSIPILSIIPLMILIFAANLAAGATLTVANTADSGAGSLRQAILDAGSGDTVAFSVPVSDPNCTAGSCVIALTSGPLVIDKTLAIVGPGARNLEVRQTDAMAIVFQAFNFSESISVRLDGFTISGGFIGVGFGSASGTLELAGISVQNNTIGLYNITGNLLVNRTTVKNNVNSDPTIFPPVGGIFNNGDMEITNSTISDNNGSSVGGILSFGTSLALINSTVSNNSTAAGGMGGGISQFAGSLTLRNTIVAGNTADTGPDIFNGGAAVVSYGNNLIGNNDTVATEFPIGSTNANGDHVGVSSLLGPLQSNGGQTDTRELIAGSPAINSGNNCVTDLTCASGNPAVALTTDQRAAGFQRLSGASVDIGAYEVQASAPTTSPVEMIESLMATITAFDPRLAHGIETALLSKLNDALAKLAVGDVAGARGCLKAFVNQVRAQTGKSIDQQRAVMLTEAANNIIVALS